MADHKHRNLRFYILGTGAALVILVAALSPADKGSVRMLPETDSAEEGTAETRSAAELSAEKEEQDRIVYAKNFLSPFYACLESGDLDHAASFMEENKEELVKILEYTFSGDRFLITEEGITDRIEGRGGVLTSPSTVFYGNFVNGVPEGNGLALQSVVIEKPRYDYSIGIFKGGRMEGPGTTGYIYYEETNSADGFKTEKAGMFKSDLMEGEVRYTSIDNTGNSTTWRLEAVNGVTKIDARWNHNDQGKEYLLLSENDKSHAYILKEEDAASAIWRNRIVW